MSNANSGLSNITGLVLTLNGERLLKKCLRSLDFCGRVVVVDSKSNDATVKIAESCGAEVLVNPWPGPTAQFEFALKHISTPWVFSLDQDEFASPELRREIRELFSVGLPDGYAGWYCPRSSFYYDRYLKHCGWYPDYLFRLFAPQRTEIGADGPHYYFRPQGPHGRFKGEIKHHPYENLHEHLNKVNYYTQTAAEEMHRRGKKSGLLKALGHGLARGMKILIVRRGFLDGRAGFILAVHGFIYGFLKYIRLAELHKKKR